MLEWMSWFFVCFSIGQEIKRNPILNLIFPFLSFFKIKIENLIFLWSQFDDSGPKAYLSDVSTTLQMLLTHFSAQLKKLKRSRY